MTSLPQRNANQLAKRKETYYPGCLPTYIFDRQACRQFIERASMPVERGLELLRQGRALWLTVPENRRNFRYILLYSEPLDGFIVLVGQFSNFQNFIVKTVLTQALFERKRHPLSYNVRNRAVYNAAPKWVYHAWKARQAKDSGPKASRPSEKMVTHAIRPETAKFAIVVEFITPAGAHSCEVFCYPPGWKSPQCKENPSAIVREDQFWTWFGKKAASFRIDVECIQALKVRAPGFGLLPLVLD